MASPSELRPMGPFINPEDDLANLPDDQPVSTDSYEQTGPLYRDDETPSGPAPLKVLKQAAAKRKPAPLQARASGASAPAKQLKIVLPKGYKLDARDQKKRKTEKPVTSDLTSNPKGEGLYRMQPAAQQGYTDTGTEIRVPFSKIKTAQTSGYDLHPDEKARYEKDFTYQDQGPTLVERADQLVQMALTPSVPAPVTGPSILSRQRYNAEKPTTQQVGQAVWEQGEKQEQAIRNILKSAGRMAYGLPGYAKQVASAYADSVRQGSPTPELLDLIDPGQLPKGLTEQYREDSKKSEALAIQNLTGSLLTLGLLHKAPEAAKTSFRALRDAYGDRVNRPPGAPPGAPPSGPRHAPTGGLTPEETRVEQSLLDRVAQHAEVSMKVRRDFQSIAPEDRQAVLDDIHQQGIDALHRGDTDAAAEAAQHAHILERVMKEEEGVAQRMREYRERREGTPAPTAEAAPPAAPPPEAVDTAIKNRVSDPKTDTEVRRGLEAIPSEGRQTALDALNQEGFEAYQRGDVEAAVDAAQRANILTEMMQAAKPAADTAAAKPTVAAPATPEPETQIPLFGAPEAAAPPAAETALPEHPATPAERAVPPRPARARTATARGETPEAAGEVPRSRLARDTTARGEPDTALQDAVEATKATEEPQTAGQLAAVIAETMSREQMLDELGVKKGSGDPQLRAATKRLALSLAVQRMAGSVVTPPAQAPAPTPEVQEAAPAAAETPVQKAVTPKPKKQTAAEARDALADFFTPGNVIYKKYWNGYDKVLDFQPGEPDSSFGWRVQVVHSDEQGNPLPGERPRWHATPPEPKRGDKVVSRAPVSAPTPEAVPAPVPEAEPGYVAKAAEKVAKKKRTAVAAAPVPVAPPVEAVAPEAVPTPAAKPKAEVEENKDEKTFEATAPEGFVDAKGESARIAPYGPGREFKTKAQARKAITQWEAGLMPVEQFKAQPPPAPVAAPATPSTAPVAPTPAEAPVAAPAAAPAGELKLKKVAGATPPTWQIAGHPNMAIMLTPDGHYMIHDGSDFVGNPSSMDDALEQARAHLSAQPGAPAPAAAPPVPETPPAEKPAAAKAALPAKAANPLEVKKSYAEAVARTRDENAKRVASAASTGHHDTPVIATNDDAMVLLDKLARQAPVTNAKVMTGARADALIVLMREFAAKDPENRQGLVDLADLMKAHRTPYGNVILHRHIMSDDEVSTMLWEEQFHDWQLKYLTNDGAKIRDIHRAMKQSPSAQPWATAMQHLQVLFEYTPQTSSIEAPAWVASGNYLQLGITDDEAVKLLSDYKERASKILGSVATDNYPTHAPALEGKVNDEVGRRNLGRHGPDITGGRGGRVDTLQPAQRKLPEEAPRTPRARKKRAAEAKAGLSEAQARQRQEERDLAPVWYLKSERVIADKMKGPMPGPDALRMLQNNGISQDELKWTGLDDYLPTAGRVTPDQVRNRIAENGIKVEEVHKGGTGDWTPKDSARLDDLERQRDLTGEEEEERQRLITRENAASKPGGVPPITRYHGYQMAGGENYREVLLTLPTRMKESPTSRMITWSLVGKDGQETPSKLPPQPASLDQIQQMRERGFAVHDHGPAMVEAEGNFRTPHWEEPNILVHVRMNDRTVLTYTPEDIKRIEKKILEAVPAKSASSLGSGAPGVAVRKGLITPTEAEQYSDHKGFYNDTTGAFRKLLHLEEIQSDWHQKGRKYRYADPKRPFAVTGVDGQFATREEAEAAAEANDVPKSFIRDERTDELPGGVLPDAPFKKTWQEMALRRMVRYAAEHGYDGVSWTGGADQAERYDLSKHISWLQYFPSENYLEAVDSNGRRVLSQHNVEEKDLPNYIGKEAADKLASKIQEWRNDSDADLEPYQDPDEGKWAILDANGDPVYDRGGGLKAFDRREDALDEIKWMKEEQRNQTPVPQLRGLDLKVGGEGLKGFYDKIVPDYLNKFGKKFGARVQATDIPNEEAYGSKPIQYLPITDEMFDSVLGEGVAMFQNRQPKPESLETLKADPRAQRPVVDWELPPEEKRRPMKSFVSPNVFNLETIKEAQERLGSTPQKLMQQESGWLLGELGTKVKSRPAIGIWEDGAENSLIHEYPRDTDPDLVIYHNAIMARAGWQKSMYNFFPQDDGPDVMYRVTLPKAAGGPENISKVLADNGIKFSTIITERDGHAVFIGTSAADDDETQVAIVNAAKELGGEDGTGARASRYSGRSEYVEGDDRDRAGEVFSRVIEDKENLHPEWRDIRTRLESRPDFVELGKFVKTEKLKPNEDTGELQSRQRQPEPLAELQEAARGREPLRLEDLAMRAEPGVSLDAIADNTKNNLNWGDIKNYLLPEERLYHERNPELKRKIVDAVNMMPNTAEWDAAVKAGMIGSLWYERSSRAFDALISAMPESFKPKDKEKFLNFVSALSPVQTVRLNLTMAIDLWDKWHKAGRPMDVEWEKPKTFEKVANKSSKLYRIMAGLEREKVPPREHGLFGAGGKRGRTTRPMRGVDLKSRLYNAIRALQGQPLSGPKVSAFAPNLGENPDKSTNDTWMAVFSDTNPNTINQKHLYDAVSAHVRMAAEKNGIPTRQAQAAIWSFIKALAELSGWGPGRWIPPQEIIDRGLIHPEAIEAQAYDFADLMQHDHNIRAKLREIGADLYVLDRHLKRKVPAKPAVERGSVKEVADRLSGAARRLEAANANERLQSQVQRKVEPRQASLLPSEEEEPPPLLSLEEIRDEMQRRIPKWQRERFAPNP